MMLALMESFLESQQSTSLIVGLYQYVRYYFCSDMIYHPQAIQEFHPFLGFQAWYLSSLDEEGDRLSLHTFSLYW